MPSLTLNFTCSSPAPTVGIEVTQSSSMVAPAQVWLRAVNHTRFAAFEESGSVYDGAHHEYYHEWTINGQPLSDWTKTANLIAAFNNPNKAYGREVAFLLPTAGSYVIDLTVRDRLGNTASASTSTITVVSPESYFANADRVYVDPDGDFTGVPGGALTATTMASLQTVMNTRAGGTPLWVLLRGSKVHDMGTITGATAGRMNITSTSRFARMSSFGTGRATIRASRAADRSSTDMMIALDQGHTTLPFFTVTGVDCEAQYEAAIQHGNVGNGGAFGGTTGRFVDFFGLFHDINFTGFSKSFHFQCTGSGTHSNAKFMVADCSATDWRDYGVYADFVEPYAAYKLAIVGNRLMQNVDALNGYDSNLTSRHGPIRIMTAAYAYIAQNDLFSRNGWSGNDDQPCLRLMVRGHDTGQAAMVERNVMEGGYHVVLVNQAEPTYLNGENGHDYIVPGNFVLHNNLIVTTAYGKGTVMQIWRGGTTVRNTVIIQPDVFQTANIGGACFSMAPVASEINPIDQDPSNASNPIVIHSNTRLCLMAEAKVGASTWDFSEINYFTNVTIENNVDHRPNMTPSTVADAPIDTSTAISGFVPRYKGLRYGYPPIDDNATLITAPVANGGSFTIPYSLLLRTLTDGTVVSPGGATDEAYWDAIAATDTKHDILLVGQSRRLQSTNGHFTVSADAGGVVVTNTSGFTWNAQTVSVHLDRTSLVPVMDTIYASPATIPLPRPTTGSPAIGAATTGRVTPADALDTNRGATPSRGALEPA